MKCLNCGNTDPEAFEILEGDFHFRCLKCQSEVNGCLLTDAEGNTDVLQIWDFWEMEDDDYGNSGPVNMKKVNHHKEIKNPYKKAAKYREKKKAKTIRKRKRKKK
ncbi:MAG: hypothetical protein K6B41_11895 [Butyrivibrio sp.]|nr:hypothetical protein [Butyrivibrio sp.]